MSIHNLKKEFSYIKENYELGKVFLEFKNPYGEFILCENGILLNRLDLIFFIKKEGIIKYTEIFTKNRNEYMILVEVKLKKEYFFFQNDLITYEKILNLYEGDENSFVLVESINLDKDNLEKNNLDKIREYFFLNKIKRNEKEELGLSKKQILFNVTFLPYKYIYDCIKGKDKFNLDFFLLSFMLNFSYFILPILLFLYLLKLFSMDKDYVVIMNIIVVSIILIYNLKYSYESYKIHL